MYIYPVDSQVVLNNLRKKVTQLEATMSINNERGRTRDPGIEAAVSDAEELRDQIQVGSERFFRYGLYVTMYADSLDELGFVQHKIETMFGQQLIFSKIASSQQEQGLNSTVPQMTDQLQIRRNMNTGAISTSFPFTSADLTQENGVLYGINMHNNGLVIFDRFSLENANLVVFAKSGAGKSFTVKLEALRSMMTGSEIIIIDPENEYQKLSDAVGGSYIRLSLNSNVRINPFDLPRVIDSDEAENALRANLITLHGLLKLMLGSTQTSSNGVPQAGLAPSEEADLDQALIDTYARVGITSDPLTHNSLPPTINELYDTLLHMGGNGPQLAQRLRKYTTGTFAGIFSQQSNTDINNPMVVFNIRDLEDELRPVAMYIILSHIWNIIRTEKKKRMLIVDEAWQLMKYDDSANFLFSLAKRARKYYLGLTTISQDVEDFMGSKMGRAVVANSSMQILLKQSSSAIDVLSDVFKLTEEEKNRLSNFPVGQGLFFAGQSHVHIQIEASDTEKQLINTNPQTGSQAAQAIPVDNSGTNSYISPGSTV
jgi:type IV secretory pathway VirB4 component